MPRNKITYTRQCNDLPVKSISIIPCLQREWNYPSDSNNFWLGWSHPWPIHPFLAGPRWWTRVMVRIYAGKPCVRNSQTFKWGLQLIFIKGFLIVKLLLNLGLFSAKYSRSHAWNKASFQVLVLRTWALFSPLEKRNIAIYIGGMMLYKFGLQAFNGSIVISLQIAMIMTLNFTTLYHKHSSRLAFWRDSTRHSNVSARYSSHLWSSAGHQNGLSVAIFVFGLLTAVLLIVDAELVENKATRLGQNTLSGRLVVLRKIQH